MGSRRAFLKALPLLSCGPLVLDSSWRARRLSNLESNEKILIVIQLDGGNDGVNTLVPYTDEGYARHRDHLFIESNRLFKLDNQVGLHPRMREMASLWERGELALIPSVGYPNPNRSHDVSKEIWQTSSPEPEGRGSQGWLGLSIDQFSSLTTGVPNSVFVGDRKQPIALQGRKNSAATIANLDAYRFRVDTGEDQTIQASDSADDLANFLMHRQQEAAYLAKRIEAITSASSSGNRYPATQLGARLRTIAQLIKVGFGPNVFYTIQDGYDTHAGQNATHGDLLASLSSAIKALLDDLRSAQLDDRVLLLGFSEFGRRVDENASDGTDHGAGGLAFLAGPNVNGGVHGDYPSLLDLDQGALRVTTDFRRIYASVLEHWLQVDSQQVLHGAFEPLGCVKKAS